MTNNSSPAGIKRARDIGAQHEAHERATIVGDTAREEALRGYLFCALWTNEFDDLSVWEDIAPEAEVRARNEVNAFIDANLDDIAEYLRTREVHGGDGSTAEHLGHDLWLNRNHHGTGFWDRGLGDLGLRLDKAARDMRESEAYIGDDGLVYLT